MSQFGRPALNDTSSGSFLSNLTNSIESEINAALKNGTDDIARVLNIHDFYSIHILDYCEGYYTPNGLAKHAKENVSRCSNSKGFFNFNATQILQSELKSGISLADLKWPKEIEDGIKAAKIASDAMFVLYCVGIAASGLALITAVLGVLAGGRLSACVNFFLSIVCSPRLHLYTSHESMLISFQLAFFALAVASALATAIIDKVVDAVNKYGKEVGASATKGTRFLAMTWVATAVMLIAAIVWIFECIVGRKREKRYVDDSGKAGRRRWRF